ncbi:MAG TPA: hypothetical protein VG820_07710, partial [Fimbriimonadaceae bacterium]|nr:hypothetical protein [Fimbriimonadaceae bacterium]
MSQFRFKLAISGFALATFGHAQTYHVIDLGVLPNTTYSTGWGVNDSGQVAGFATANPIDQSAERAFLYSAGSMNAIGSLGGSYSAGWGLNSSGEVVGGAETQTSSSHA